MNGEYCIRCESFDRRTKASEFVDGLFLEEVGGTMPLCTKCVEEVKEENEIFSSIIIENE